MTSHSCVSQNNGTTFEAKVCDLRVQEGDAVKVLLTGPFGFPLNGKACIRVVRIHYDVINANGLGRVIDP